FITCTQCGPRYSILTGLPYDREQTAMVDFDMCETCLQEYSEPADKRFLSQTNSCPKCGVNLFFSTTTDLTEVLPGDSLENAVEKLKNGDIVAVKGLGGYLLLCDATNAATVEMLRKRKQRPTKPFAVLYPDVDVLAGDALLQKAETDLLESPVSPVVLLPLKKTLGSGLAVNVVAPGLHRLGAMLPYAPVLLLISKGVNRPLVATSANISGSPIIFRDETVTEMLGAIADYVLSNNREITMPQDDSVQTFSPQERIPILFRRSRGLAPSLRLPDINLPNESVFCAGADIKSAFAYAHQGQVYVSQFLGDMEHFDTQEHYRHVLNQFLSWFQVRPGLVVADQHPGYFSGKMAAEYAQASDVPIIYVQHHEAHFAAVLAENNLLQSREPVLGVVWDGTGYGRDGHIWGGEFFSWQEGQTERLSHWSYFPNLAGEKMAREPRLAALAVCGPDALLEHHFSAQEWTLYLKLRDVQPALKSSSMGRMFDAAAAVLGLISKNTYEGEAALLLESLASPDEPPYAGNYLMDNGQADTQLLFRRLLDDRRIGTEPAVCAGRWLRTLVEVVRQMAEHHGFKHIAFSGGVFQNALLLDLLSIHLKNHFKLYFHRQLSPNDECIAVGQLVVASTSNINEPVFGHSRSDQKY
ncbi:MAG: carbamoyltransferase HypF, partial [Saprospiraceae bacterium]|nr:carbamoyltransferase HypF [Saprospiraceae bacterium]